MNSALRQPATPIPPPELAVLADRARVCRSTRELQSLLEQLPDALLDLQRFARFEGGAAHCVLHGGDSLQIALLGWLPGGSSEIHDHGARCAVRVLRGRAVEARYELDESGRAVEVSRDTYLPGSVMGYGEAEIHSTSNDIDSGEPLLTLHLYAPAPRIRAYPPAIVGRS
jgi:hypothetical protein